MRLILDIAATNQDPRGVITEAVFDRWATLDPTTIHVHSTLEEKQIGTCVRLWRQENELWAEMELDESVRLYDRFHCEALAGLREGGNEIDLHAVMVTNLPRGMLGALLRRTGTGFLKKRV